MEKYFELMSTMRTKKTLPLDEFRNQNQTAWSIAGK